MEGPILRLGAETVGFPLREHGLQCLGRDREGEGGEDDREDEATHVDQKGDCMAVNFRDRNEDQRAEGEA